MATGPQAYDNHAVKIDRIISRAVDTMRGNPLVVFGVSLIFVGIPGAAINAVSRRFGGAQPTSRAELGARGVAALVGGLLVVVLYVLAQGALVRATTAQAEGKRAGFGTCVATGLRASVPLIALSILTGIAVLLGFLVFVVPGVILFLMWAVAGPALVAERIGIFAALGRSRFLTKGARWKVFGVELIATVFVWLISSLLSIMLFASGGIAGFVAMGRTGPPLWYLALSVVIQTFVIAIWATIQASLYIELRDWKDGPQGAALADVFA